MLAKDQAQLVAADQDVKRYEEDLYSHLEARATTVLTGIAEKKVLDDETKGALEAALIEFNKGFVATPAGAAA